MKYCPQCRNTYADETLKFCREDGTLLRVISSYPTESSDTLTLPVAHASDAQPTKLLPSGATQSNGATSSSDTTRHLLASGASDIHTASSAEYFVSRIRRHKRGVAIVLSVMILAAAGVGLRLLSNRSVSTKQIESIAVLPFVNESGSADNEYLSDGMTETLISNLSQIPKLNVKARSSVFRYKGKETDTQTIGKELNVQAILNGRVVQRGEQLVVYLELVDAQTGNRIWGDQYNRKTSDLVSLQGEIARDVSNKLKAKLSGADEQRLAKSYTENPEAYQLYLKGRFHWNKRTQKDYAKAVEYFQQAIVRDPNFALGYAGLADAYAILSDLGGAPPRETMPKAKEAALKALSLENNLAEAHTSLGSILTTYDLDFAGAEREYKRAIELNPDYGTAHQWYALLLCYQGRFEEASAEFRRALEIEPLSLPVNQTYGHCLYLARRYDEAITQLKKTLELDANYQLTRGTLAAAYRAKGNYAEAVEASATDAELSGDRQRAALLRESFARGGQHGYLRALNAHATLPLFRAGNYAEIGEKDKAFAELNKLAETRQFGLVFLRVYPPLDPLRADPRFQELLRSVGFPP
jgi:TolB-like protein